MTPYGGHVAAQDCRSVLLREWSEAGLRISSSPGTI